MYINEHMKFFGINVVSFFNMKLAQLVAGQWKKTWDHALHVESAAPRSCNDNRGVGFDGQDWLSGKKIEQWSCWFWENIDVWEDEVSPRYNGNRWVLVWKGSWLVLTVEECGNTPIEHKGASSSSCVVVYEQSCSLVNICDPCKRCSGLVMGAWIETGGIEESKYFQVKKFW